MSDIETNRPEVDTATKLLLQSAILKALKAEHDALRAQAVTALDPDIEPELSPGDKKAPRYLGVKIGSVSLSDPDPEPVIEDVDELDAWSLSEGKYIPVGEPYIVPDRMVEAIAVLREHAPHLVAVPDVSTTRVPDWFRKDVVAKLFADGALPPGVELKEKVPVLTVRPSKDSASIVRQFLESSNLLALEGGVDRE